ncbi:MAG: hypothetical protein R3E48_02100 [Burkholderiaceae bacterium]
MSFRAARAPLGDPLAGNGRSAVADGPEAVIDCWLASLDPDADAIGAACIVL